MVDACADHDPWRGFAEALTGLVELNVANRGFVDAFTATQPQTGALVEHRRELVGLLADLARRAQRAGALRADFTVEDLVLVLRAGRGLAAGGTDTRAAHARRFAALLLDAFAAPR